MTACDEAQGGGERDQRLGYASMPVHEKRRKVLAYTGQGGPLKSRVKLYHTSN